MWETMNDALRRDVEVGEDLALRLRRDGDDAVRGLEDDALDPRG